MKIDPNNYPYPFLSDHNDNYINSKFSANAEDVKLNQDTDNFEIDVEVLLENKVIEELLQKEDLSLSIHVECSKTFYNKTFKVVDDVTTISIENSKVAGRIELNALLTMNRTIDDYTNDDFHRDFDGLKFSLIPGNILGAATAGEIVIDSDIPEDIESIFILKKNSKLNPGEINADYNTNKIVIYVSEKDYNNYQRIQVDKHLRPILYSLVVVPVLVDLIHYINKFNNPDNESADNEFDDIKDLDWFKSIEEKLDKLDINVENEIGDPIIVANNLIDDPLKEALSVLLESGEEDE